MEFTRLAWFGGELAEFAQPVTFDLPFQPIAADTDGAPDFTGADVLTLIGAFPLLHELGSLTDPMLLGAFTGTSSMFLEERVRFLPSSPSPGIFFHDAKLAQSTGGVIWRHQYTPASDLPLAVPEPASLALVLIAAMGMMVQATGHRRISGPTGSNGARAAAPDRSGAVALICAPAGEIGARGKGGVRSLRSNWRAPSPPRPQTPR